MTHYMKRDVSAKKLGCMTPQEIDALFNDIKDDAFVLCGEDLYFISKSRCVHPVFINETACNPQINAEDVTKIRDIISPLTTNDEIIEDKPPEHSLPSAPIDQADDFDGVDDIMPVGSIMSRAASAFSDYPSLDALTIERGREKLGPSTMGALKLELDRAESNPMPVGQTFTFDQTNWHDLGEGLSQYKPLVTTGKNPRGIPVSVIEKEGSVLVKVGPCDLSGVGGHAQREKIISAMVTKALQKSGSDRQYKDVNVSVASGVRGRLQMFLDSIGFASAAKKLAGSGTHMNAYVKTAGEESAMHWEPRKGPQSFFNDTVCALVTSIATQRFENEVLAHKGAYSSAQATEEILKNKDFKTIFDRLLERAKSNINEIKSDIAAFKQKMKEIHSSGTPVAGSDKDEVEQEGLGH